MVCRLTWRWLAGLVLLGAMPVAGQVEYGNLHAGANGELTTGYTGAFGNLQNSDHSWGVGGNGTINGYYYNPNFLSFSVIPYYDRSQNNSDSQSITDSSGYIGNLNIFNGSHFPGYVSFNQQWNNSGTFGIPGMAGLTTNNKSHGFSVGWSALLPDWPTLSVSYSDTTSSSSLYGSDSSSDSTNRAFRVGSSYHVAGFYLNGGFNHITTDANIKGVLENGGTETTDGSSNVYHLNVLRALPFHNSQLAVGVSRSDYNDDFSGGHESGTTDNANANLTLQFPKLPVNVYANYTDNLFGAFQQQLVGSGQPPVQSLISPGSRSLAVGASAFYSVLPRLTVSGYVNHTEQFFNGQDYGLTQFGGNVSYAFFRRLKGLSFTVGMVDSANQQGNTRAGFIGNVDYRRSLGRWDIDTYFRYDQDVETLLVAYTTSTMTYGATVKRQLPHDLRWVAVATGTRSVFEQHSGEVSYGESFTTMLMWRRVSASANYMQSNGTAILTAGGLVGVPVPGQEIPPSNLVFFSGKSYGGSLRYNPTRSLGFTASYSKSDSNTISPILPSNNSSTQYYGLVTYRLRKLLFTAGATNFRQSISTSGTPPGVVTSYYFGVSRWFKAF
jgi:hypothetical protein